MNIQRFPALLVAAGFTLLAFLAQAADAIYPDVSRAGADIEGALKEAARSHKRVLVDFGGNWCGDCKVLDLNLRKPENAALLEKQYVVVHVNVGDKGIDHNFDVAERYGIPLKKGVPALAVLEADGKVVYAQKSGEFESMRTMDPQSVNDFLRKWQGKAMR
jgi:thiol:disulfide interchange protein